MRRTITRLALLLASLPLATFACNSKGSDVAATAPVVEPQTTASAAPAVTAVAEPGVVAPPQSAAPVNSGSTVPVDTAVASDAVQPGEKVFDCGGKGQKLCPMQAWMKGTMVAASSSGDGEKIHQAFLYVAGKPPPGMAAWSTIAKAGAAKAKAGDVDGAKASCEQCHEAFKDRYKKTLRDRPF